MIATLKYVVFWVLAAAVSVLAGISSKPESVSIFESALGGVIGAIVGGVVAALAFIFAVLAKIIKTTAEEGDSKVTYRALTTSLKSDVVWLIYCLAASVFLPLIRKTDIPYLGYPSPLQRHFPKDALITAAEVLVVIIAISVLLEICECMFQALVAEAT